MPHCFVPGCKSGYPDNTEKRSLFRPPKDKDIFAKWSHNIPRADKKLDDKARVCDIHFEEGSIEKFNEYIIDGKVVRMDKPWTLKKDAVPTIFPSMYCLLICVLLSNIKSK